MLLPDFSPQGLTVLRMFSQFYRVIHNNKPAGYKCLAEALFIVWFINSKCI